MYSTAASIVHLHSVKTLSYKTKDSINILSLN